MSEDFDRDALVSIFIIEATDGLAKLRELLQSSERAHLSQDHDSQASMTAHKIRGAAALYGFTGIAGLAEILESSLEEATELDGNAWLLESARLADLVAAIQAQVEHVARTGGEEPGCLDAWKLRIPTASPAATPHTLVPPDVSATLTDEYLRPELDPEVFGYFAPEAQEYLESLETLLLKVDKNAEDPELIHQLFRTAHTLKGSAYTVGFQAVGDITHHVEDFMGAVREGRLRLTPSLADIMLRVVDVIRVLMRLDSRLLSRTRQDFAAVMQRLRDEAERLLQSDTSTSGSIQDEETVCAVPEHVEPEEGKGEEGKAIPPPPESEARGEGESSVIRVSRDRLERLMNLVGELVIGRGRLEQRQVMLEQLSQQVLGCKARMVDAVRTFEDRHAFTTVSQTASGDQRPGPDLPVLADFGALEFDKYDDFNILARRMSEVSADVGESIAQLVGSIRKAREDMGQLHQLMLGMRDEIARARMVPVGTPFVRFRRAIREMARTTGKEVQLVTSGEQTEVDTGVVERLVDPLIHLVRNAVYHGIETPAARVAAGKPAVGTIYLHASHRGNAVVIEVEDDGAGIHLDKVKSKAVAMGLIRAELAPGLPDYEAIGLLFAPGFSTAEGIGGHAGRGVGLDVVKKAIEGMNGRIEVETAQGVGTKFTLVLPLTLLISTALLVRVGAGRYALPLPSIREVVWPMPGSMQAVNGRTILQHGQEAIEVRALGVLLGSLQEGPLSGNPVVIVRTATGVVGLSVDELLGRQEIVIKSLGPLRLFQESVFAGASIDPEGRVVLVMDVARLVGGRTTEEQISAQTKELPDRTAETARDLNAGGYVGRSTRVLLVDDSLSVRKFVGRMLEGAGYDIDTAVDGEDGLRKINEGSYGLVITDLEMPKLNGYELIRTLRERAQTRTLPIVVMTTRAGDKHRQMAMTLGASSYVSKPVEERALTTEVARWIGPAAGTRA